MKKAIIYVHGKGGSALEAENFKKNCPGFDMIGIDYQEYLPWIVREKIQVKYDEIKFNYDQIDLVANSIGVYFSMLALQNSSINKALFISPILDMKKSIYDKLQLLGLTTADLENEGEIVVPGSENLSWKYLQFVEDNPINWQIPTEILYGQNDDHTSRETLDSFIQSHNAHVTIMKNGQHWFHTKEQVDFLNHWMESKIREQI
ncbi:alpha/beta hydrolase [Companilactobacillus crustorum]|nr:alpha/beta hydrolase [Companilactobacillus crustorum]WDT65236.1 alpha/beta hydrolase [Companilactobacillus crustorum]